MRDGDTNGAARPSDLMSATAVADRISAAFWRRISASQIADLGRDGSINRWDHGGRWVYSLAEVAARFEVEL